MIARYDGAHDRFRPDDDTVTFHRLVDGADVAMFVTLDHQGRPCSRPFTFLTSPDQAALWAVVPKSASVVKDVQSCADIVVHLTSQSGILVAITGRAHVHHDRASAAVCSIGSDSRACDDDLALLHVIVDSVESWTSASSDPEVLHFVKPVGMGQARARRSIAQLH